MTLKKYNPFKLALVLAIIGLIFVLIPGAKSSVKPYYSGSAVAFRGSILVGTANTGFFELFNLSNSRLIRTAVIKSDDSSKPVFHDALLKVEDDRLYVYLVNGTYLYKYDISDPNSILLTAKIKDNSYDYFYGLTGFNDRIVTTGSKGLKIWNKELQNIDTFKVILKDNRNVGFHNNGVYFNLADNGDTLDVFDAFYHELIREIPLTIDSRHNRKQYIDPADGATYIVDDSVLNKIGFDGAVDTWRHTSNLGYDVAGIDGSAYIYFSDGIGIVKSRRSDLGPVSWNFSGSIGPGNGWAMGLEAVSVGGEEYAVLFNGSSIVVFNNSLIPVDFYAARETEEPMAEPLYLNTEPSGALPDFKITVKGGGFSMNELIEITIDKKKYSTYTDNNGEFNKIIWVPSDIKAGITDIKATGFSSKLTYSTSFEVY